MARAPKFNAPRTTPPASGWKAGHRAPALGFGQLDGVCVGPEDLAECPALRRELRQYEDAYHEPMGMPPANRKGDFS